MAEYVMLTEPLDDASLWIDVILLLILILASVFKHRRGPGAWKFLFWSGIALLVTFVAAHINRWCHWWKAHEDFPSGHVTFFLCAATSIILLYRWSWILLLPSAVAYSWLIVDVLHKHLWLDAAGAWIMAPPLTWLCHNWQRIKKT